MNWRGLFLFLLLLIVHLSYAQRIIDFDYTINQPYPRTIGELVAENSNISFTILNDIPRDINIYLKAELLITDAFGVERGSIRTPGSEFIPQSTIIIEANESLGIGLDFSFGDFGFTLDNLIFEGTAANYFQSFNATDQQGVDITELLNPQLPEGTYTLCLTAFEVGSNEQLSPRICSESFDIVSTNVFISNPLSGDIVDCEVLDIISWELDEGLADPNCMDFLVEVIQVEETSLALAQEQFFDNQYRVVREIVMGENFLDEALNQTTLDFTLIENQDMYYALRVKATLNNNRDSDCEVTLRNGGYSDISIFQIKCDEDLEEEIPTYDCATCDQASPPAEELIVHSFSNLPETFSAGYFNVKVRNSSLSASNAFNGEGTVDVSLFGIEFPVGVELKNIQLNEDKELIAGEVITLPLAQNEDFTSRVTVPDGIDYTLADVKKRDEESYNNFVEALSTVDEVMAQIEGTMNGEGLKMPLGFDQVINGKNFKIVLDEMNFTTGSANMRSTFNLPLPFETNGSTAYLSFGLSKLCFTPDGSVQNGRVHMVYDLPVFSSEDGYGFEIKGCEDCTNADDSKGSFLEFDCDGVTGGRFECAISFPNKEGTEDEGALSLSPYRSAYNDPADIPDKVEAVFGILINEQSEDSGWIFDASMTPFEVGALDNWGFEVKNASIDLSEIYNPSQLEFPDDHIEYGRKFDFNSEEYLELTRDQEEKLPLWTGLYLREIDVHLPPQLRGDALETFSIQNAVLDFGDDFNLSLSIKVDDPFKNKILKLGRWNSKLESVDVALVNNEFKRGSIGGQLFAPFLHQDDHFAFNAVMHKSVSYDEMEYAFIINPGSTAEEAQPFRVPMFLAQVTLNNASYISLNYSESKDFIFKTNLFGKLGMSPETTNWLPGVSQSDLKQLPLELLGVPFILSYETDKGFAGTNFALTPNLKEFYDLKVADIRADKLALDESLSEMDQAFNPPPDNNQEEDTELKKKTLAGFELSFREFELAGDIDKPRLYLEPYMHIMGGGGTADQSEQTEVEEKNGFGLGALIFVESTFDETTNKYGKLNFGLECLTVDVQTASVKMSGGVCYKRTDREKSFRGGLNIELEQGGKGISMAGSFGTRYKSNGEKDISFWYARVALKDDVGIPIGPLNVNGLGGGVFWNYKISDEYFNSFGRGSFEPMDPLDKSLHDNIVPQAGNFALAFFILGSPEGTDVKTLNLDATLRLALGRGTVIGLGGNVYAMSEDPWTPVITLNQKSMIYGSFDASFTFGGSGNGKGEFLLSSALGVNIPPDKGIYKGDVTSEILVNSDEFHAYFGVPGSYDYTTRKGLKMQPAYIGTNLGNDQAGYATTTEFYLMIGDGIPSQLYLPQEIRDLMAINSVGDADADWVSDISGEQRPPTLGSGVAFGAMVSYGANFWLIEEERWKTGFGGFVLAGFDINLTKSYDRSCGSYSPPGHEGWYALGQIYAGGSGEIYALGRELAKLSAVALLQGGLPNPVWVDGKVRLSYKVFVPVFLDEAVKGAIWTAEQIAGRSFNIRSEKVGGEKIWQIRDGHNFRGSFNVDFSYGDKCIPSIDYDNSDEAPIDIIKSITPADGQEEVDFLSIEPSLELHYGHNTLVRGIQIVERGKLRTIRLKPKIKLFELEERRSGSWSSVEKLDSSDFNTGSKFRRMRSMEMKPDTRYRITVIVDLYRGNNIFDTVEKQHTFKTGEIPEKLSDDFVEQSIPGSYELFFNHEDFDKGYIQFNAAAFNVLFGDGNLSLVGSGSNNTNGSGPGRWFRGVSDLSDMIGVGNENNPLSNAPSGTINNPPTEPTGPRFEPIPKLPTGTNPTHNQSYKNQVRITDLNNPVNSTTVLATINHSGKRISFSLGGLKKSTAYSLVLEMKDSEGRYRRVYETSFITSRYGTIEDKLANGSVESSSFQDAAIEFEEPFDNYSINRFNVLPAISDLAYNRMGSWLFDQLDVVRESLEKDKEVNAKAFLSIDNSGGDGMARFSINKSMFLDVSIQTTWADRITRHGSYNFALINILGRISSLKTNKIPLSNGRMGIEHYGASVQTSKELFETVSMGDLSRIEGLNRIYIPFGPHRTMMSNIKSTLGGISTFLLSVNAGDVDWKFKAGFPPPGVIYDITVDDPYKKYFESSSMSVKNAFISFALFGRTNFFSMPAYRLFSGNNSGTIYNF